LGLVALAFDKRGSGESQGDWTDASLDDLAGDATAAMAFLAARPEVDPARIGVWGVSQAGWVVPLLAGRAQRPAFSIVVTGGGADRADASADARRPRRRRSARSRQSFSGAVEAGTGRERQSRRVGPGLRGYGARASGSGS